MRAAWLGRWRLGWSVEAQARGYGVSATHSMRIEFGVRPGEVAAGGVEADGRSWMRAH